MREDAERSAILETRALWFFSELAKVRPGGRVEAAARGLYRYVVDKFVDAEHGGLVWSVGPAGEQRSARKQVYAQAFAVYAFSAYAGAFDDREARGRALALAALVEARAWESGKGGYVEAFSRDWSAIDDWRLSERDLNAPKTMNTHLHVLEAMTALHRLAGNDFTAATLAKNIDLFIERFIAPRGAHVSLFYDMDWVDRCGDESYGHDIEASWLLCEAASALDDKARLAAARVHALRLAEAALGALDEDGGLVYERGEAGLDARRHWWPQAEALVGFYNAYELTGEKRYEAAAAGVWAFIRQHQIDRANGEWFWFSAADKGAPNPYKAGFWKGPYHNGRAMMEMLRRLGEHGDD